MAGKSDSSTTIDHLKQMTLEFVRERDWEQFHTPKNLSMAIAIEAAELMEKFRFIESKDSYEALKEQRAEVEDEVADIIWATVRFAHMASIDISSALEKKLASTAKRYPVEKVRGKVEYGPAKGKKE